MAPETAPPPVRPRRRVRRVMTRLALAWVVLLALSSLLAPLVLPGARDAMDLNAKRQAPSWQHPFGTDALGRDTLARVLYGGRISLVVALWSTCIAVTVGTGLGLSHNNSLWIELLQLFDQLTNCFFLVFGAPGLAAWDHDDI